MKEKFLEHRLELSEDLSFAIIMEYKEQISQLKEEIDRIDKILEIIK